MSTQVIMPQMGESIAEGTITKWLKKVGDTVKRDEPIFEISTDKVDAEIPSPVAGTLLEIKVNEGQTVAINTVVGVIGEAGEKPAAAPAAASAPEPAAAPGETGARPGRRTASGAQGPRRNRRSPRLSTDRRPHPRRPLPRLLLPCGTDPRRARPRRRAARSSRSRSESGAGPRRSCARSRRSMRSKSVRSKAPESTIG